MRRGDAAVWYALARLCWAWIGGVRVNAWHAPEPAPVRAGRGLSRSGETCRADRMAEANARRERGTATGRPARNGHRAETALLVLLVALTAATGMVDAVSYLGLEHVFTANMTGNVVLLGFALAGTGQVSIPASLLTIAAFLAGAAGAGRLGRRLQARRYRWIGLALGAEALLVGSAALVALDVQWGPAYAVVVLLAWRWACAPRPRDAWPSPT